MSQAIKTVSGVQSVEVHYDAKQAIVQTSACTSADFDALSAALERAGYAGVVKSVTPVGYQPP